MPRNASVSASGEQTEETAKRRTSWAELMHHMNVRLTACVHIRKGAHSVEIHECVSRPSLPQFKSQRPGAASSAPAH